MRLQMLINRRPAIIASAAVILLALPSFSAATVDMITVSAPAASAPSAAPGDLHAAATVAVKKKVHAAGGLLAVVNHEDITQRHQVIADNTLRSLPPQCRDNLRTFYVNYDVNPKNRGLGGADTIIIVGNVPDAEFRALLVHECGHVADLGGFRGTPSSGTTEFMDGNEPIYGNDPSVAFYRISWDNASTRKQGASKADFVSGYAMSDPFEDFAESFAYYVLQKKDFARLAKKNKAIAAKYAWFEKHLSGVMTTVAMGKNVRGAKEPWDVTKLPYTWLN